ncbi:Eco57I restriction-modification methylase domain-containing protein [Haloarchaeobius sp. HRN-SO-5]|uniref:Eco57I restriction-modification methylase domain-containing protein n=1 Tax=Haloarchaeobius sp. HRN-SO-5 TaxID=3446118 RepID=UPI003EB9F35E
MRDSEEINRLHRRGTGSNARSYPPTPVPSPVTSGGIAHSPVAPVGLDGRRSEQVDDVIRQLTSDGHEIPAPFSKGALYQTAASVGIEVWKPAVKDRITNRVLDRLSYEWDSVSQSFAPVVTDELIEDIQQAAGTVTPAFDMELSESLREQILEWCDLHGLGSFDTGAVQRTIARHAVLSVLLKSALYEWYRCRDVVPPLIAPVQQAFHNARKRTGDGAFDTFVLDHVAELADKDALESALAHRDRLLFSPQPTEDIGKLYAELTPSEYRQSLGQFRTPPEIAATMKSWANRDADHLLDPGMGAGVLSSAFHPRWRLNTDPTHVDGIERSPLARVMGATALTLSGQLNTPRMRDFLDLDTDDLQRDITGIVCNPPYTSGDALPKKYKNRINAAIEQSTGIDVSARSPLYAYFLLHARSFLSSGDRAAFLTPDSFLTTAYGESLKQFLLDEFSITALVQFDPAGESVFEDAQVTALVSFLEASSGGNEGETRFIRVDESIDSSTLHNAVQNGEQGETEWGFINHVPQADLVPGQNWAALFNPCDVDTSELTELGEFVTIHRGKSTGDVTFFCLTQNEVDESGISEKHLSRLIRQPKLVDGYDFREADWEQLRVTGEEVWLLDPDELPDVPKSRGDFEKQVLFNADSVPRNSDGEVSNVVSYLLDSVYRTNSLGANVIENRPYWYRPRRQASPRFLVQDAGRDGFTFILNETTARNINNFRGFYDMSLEETELKALLAYLNSNIGQQVIQTQTQPQQGGYEKLSISALNELPVIDPTSLEEPIVATLADLFDELRDTAKEGGNCDSVLNRLDSLVQQVM